MIDSADCWLLEHLGQDSPVLRETVASAREAAESAWRGIDNGWFFRCDAAHGDRVAALLAEVLAPCRLSLREILTPHALAALLCAAYGRGLGLAELLAKRDRAAPWTTDEFQHIDQAHRLVAAARLASEQRALGGDTDPQLRQAISLLCLVTHPTELRGDPKAQEVPASYRLPLLAALLLAMDEADRHHSRAATTLDGMPGPLLWRHYTAQRVREIAWIDSSDGRKRLQLRLAPCRPSEHVAAMAWWLERDIARRLRSLEPILREELPASCRLAPLPLCAAGEPVEEDPAFSAALGKRLELEVARAKTPGRAALRAALEAFAAAEEAGAALLSDTCGRGSDAAELLRLAAQTALAKSRPAIVIDCEGVFARPTLADVLQAVLETLGVAAPPAARDQADAVDAGAVLPAAARFAQALLNATHASALVILRHVDQLTPAELGYLGRQVLEPLLRAGKPALRIVLHGAATAHNRRLIDFFPCAFSLVAEVTPLQPAELRECLQQEGGYTAEEALERAQRILKLTTGHPRAARVLIDNAIYGKAW